MKILICGATGQLGQALTDVLWDSDFTCYGTYHHSQPSKNKIPLFPLDITDAPRVRKLLSQLNPDIIINAAAMTDVDRCEIEQEQAYQINVEGNKNLLAWCRTSTLFVYISTYYVFDGNAGVYSETDEPHPLNYYGKTKLTGERDAVLHANSLIIRTSKIFSIGYDQRNFIARLHKTLAQGQMMKIIDDQVTNPIAAHCLAGIIVELIRRNKSGTYHIGGMDRVSNYEFAIRFATHFSLNTALIVPCSSEGFNQVAPRPKLCSLSLTKLRQEGMKTPDLNTSLKELRESYGRIS